MDKDIIQGYRVKLAREHGINVAIIYDRIAFWADKGGRSDGYIFKTYEQMSNETALSKKQIMLAYEKLEKMKVIETKIIKAYGAPTKHFRFLRKVTIDSDERSLSMDSDERSLTSNMTNHDKHTEPSASPVSFGAISNSDSAADAAARGTNPLRNLLQEVIDIINPREKPTQERLRMLSGRLKDYTTDEIVASALAFSKSTWHKQNKQMSVDNLLAPSKFGRWYAQRSEQDEVVQSKDLEHDEIIAQGDVFPADWPKDTPEFERIEDSDGDEEVFFRGVKINYKTQGEMGRITEARDEKDRKEREERDGVQ